MEWTRALDGYCERVDASYWSEPINAVTNLAFLIAAAILWRRCEGLPLARALCVILAAIGAGSYLFHTHATVWSAMLDVLPIVLFILLYVFVANYHFWRLPFWGAVLLTAAFLPYAAAAGALFDALPFFEISSFYWPVPVLILVYAALLRRRHPATARGLAIGAAILVVSLIFRSLDGIVCTAIPFGTHFMWHILNGIMLGWMIATYRAHMLASVPARG